MEFSGLPVGKRTRSQKARIIKEQNKKVRLAARNKWLEWREKCLEGEKSAVEKNENYDEDEVDAMVIDEHEFLKAVEAKKSNFCGEIALVKKELVEYDDDDDDNGGGNNNVGGDWGGGIYGNSKTSVFAEVTDYGSDESVQIIGEKWNPLSVGICETEDEEGEEVGPVYCEGSSSGEDDNANSDEDFGLRKSGDYSSSDGTGSEDDEEVEEKVLENLGLYKDSSVPRKVRKRRDKKGGDSDNVVDDDGGKKRRKKEKKKKEKKERGSSSMIGDGGVVSCVKTAVKKRYTEKRTEKALNKSLEGEGIVKEVENENFRVPISEGVERSTSVSASSSSSDEEDDDKMKYQDDGDSFRDIEDERQPKPRKPRKKLKDKEVESVLLNTILEKGSVEGLEGVASSGKDQEDKNQNQDQDQELRRKFRFGNEEVVLEKSEYELELEDLFKELDFGLGVCDIGAKNSSSSWSEKEVEDAELCQSAAMQEKLCREGKHYLILDEEIGIKCKFCSYVALEIRDVTPTFNENPFGRSSRNTRSGRCLDNENFDGFQFPESNCDLGVAREDGALGTVWDLIPGVKDTLYEHQQQGFEFIWTNVAGGTNLEDLDKPSKFGIGGCIICHAPGTGKTRLAIVFLQSYLKRYPMSKPVIIAPSSMLLTWEEQFSLWNVNIPFLNLNSTELSNKEIDVLGFVGDVKHKAVRKAKLCIWAMGKGILGISYPLFEKLAGERKGTEERIKKALLEQPGLLILDEGHTPRNDESNIWKVFSEVHTKKRIILSGTPFQNNFDELNNTLSIIRDEFRDPFLRANQHFKGGRNSKTNKNGFSNGKAEEERRIEGLRNRMKPFVHVHKGEILRKALRGLFHSVLVLKPSELQKLYFRYLVGIRCCLLSDYLVSIASIHPSILARCEQVPDVVDKKVLERYKSDLDAGVKIKFLLELIKLSKGEKVLVFSQFLHPLTFIGEMLQLHFNWTEGNQYLLMVGKQRPAQRQSSIGLFNDPKSDARVLLASTKACSEGIHLVGASRVVLLDVVWNPSVERQAISRAYRLGQKKDVYVYHLITSSPQEGEKYYRQVAKDRVSEQVFTSSEGDGVHKTSTLSNVSEDRVLEEMIQHEKMKNLFERIIYQPKVDNLIESFAPLNL